MNKVDKYLECLDLRQNQLADFSLPLGFAGHTLEPC
jgi:hypothetical protein